MFKIESPTTKYSVMKLKNNGFAKIKKKCTDSNQVGN